MANISLVVTDDALTFLPQMWAGLATFREIDEFKVGEGGWITTSGGTVPRDPDPTLTDLDAIVNPSRYPSDSVGTFTKSLAGAGISYDNGTKTLIVPCALDFGEFNDDGFGNSPQIYEIGLFSLHPTSGRIMVAYGTFPEVAKHAGNAPVITCNLAWSRS